MKEGMGMPKMVPEYREEAKRRIVQAGLEAMYEKGYCKTTMDDIAARLDVSKPALYRYFKNKDELVVESAKILQGQYRKVTDQDEPDRCPVRMWIDTFDQMMTPNLNEHALLLELFAISVREPVIRDFSVERMKNGIEKPARMIAEQQNEGLVSQKTDPRTLAIACVSMFNGMRMMLLLGVEREELRARWVEIVRTLFGIPDECPQDCAGCGKCGGAEPQ